MVTPDHVPCRHCGQPISWDEVCWTHDSSGFSTCGTVVRGGTTLVPGITLDPDIIEDPQYNGKTAEPVGDWE